MRQLMVAVFVLGSVGVSGVIQAAGKPDPIGTWKWTVQYGEQSRESTLKLDMKEGKLVGTMVGRDNTERPIEDPKFRNGQVSFSVTRERDGQKMVFKYNGKLSGDAIKGKIQSTLDGKPYARDWDAKRVKPA